MNCTQVSFQLCFAAVSAHSSVGKKYEGPKLAKGALAPKVETLREEVKLNGRKEKREGRRKEQEVGEESFACLLSLLEEITYIERLFDVKRI